MAEGPAFVLSGGGNLGAMQVGALRALVEGGVRPTMIVGTSVGAVNGAFLASHPGRSGIEEIVSFWSSLRRRDVLGVRAFTLINGLLGNHGYLFDAGPMRRVLESFVSFRRLEDAPIRLAVVATDLAAGVPVVLERGDVLTALLASCAIHGILPPVEIEGHLLGDGGASADIPLREAIALGARDIVVLPTAPPQVDRLRRQVALRPALDATAGEVTVRIFPPPNVHIPLGDLRYSPRLIELGYTSARQWMAANAPPECTPEDPSSAGRRRGSGCLEPGPA